MICLIVYIINDIGKLYEEYIQYNLIIKTIIVLSYEVFCYKPDNESYKISSIGNERLAGSGKETIIDIDQSTQIEPFLKDFRYLSKSNFQNSSEVFLVILMIVFLIHVMYLKI